MLCCILFHTNFQLEMKGMLLAAVTAVEKEVMIAARQQQCLSIFSHNYKTFSNCSCETKGENKF